MGIRGDRHEMFGDRLDILIQCPEQPFACALCIGHRLERGEGLRGDDEERFSGIEIAASFCEIGPIDIGNKTKREGPFAVVLKGFVGHHRPEVRAPNADVDNVANALAGVALPGAAADPVAEISHPVEHGVDSRDHVLAINKDGSTFRGAQGHV